MKHNTPETTSASGQKQMLENCTMAVMTQLDAMTSTFGGLSNKKISYRAENPKN
jgi:hypothetical protein